jgi:hypothetical protein
MCFDPGLARLFITSTLLHLGEDINFVVVSGSLPEPMLIKSLGRATMPKPMLLMYFLGFLMLLRLFLLEVFWFILFGFIIKGLKSQ